MIDIRPLAAPPGPVPIEPEPPPSPARSRPERDSAPLDTAVTLDLSPEAKRTIAEGRTPPAEPDPSQVRIRRDPDTRLMVFQVLDPASGSIIDQLPTEQALRAKTYARDVQTTQATAIGTTVARTA
ncbi:hypothetical protein [Methylobacterium oryzisoli]|uniref:hypothetical protein n=1 Tax=Methylobacterium oryzisoli TaxID=3385502 RepID=UPI003891DA23